jgi:hypothetical protein
MTLRNLCGNLLTSGLMRMSLLVSKSQYMCERFYHGDGVECREDEDDHVTRRVVC